MYEHLLYSFTDKHKNETEQWRENTTIQTVMLPNMVKHVRFECTKPGES